MAEGLLRSMYGDRYEVHSAGTHPTEVSPYAIEAMAKIGIDLSSHSAKSVENYKTVNFDYVITLCNEASEECPVFPNAEQMLHKSFPDPTATDGSKAEVVTKVSKVRDQIKKYIKEQFGGKKIN